jgi:hypothetical protein
VCDVVLKLLLALIPMLPFALTPGLPFALTPGKPFCLGHEPKVRVATKLPWFPTNTIGKAKGVWPTFISFPGAQAF